MTYFTLHLTLLNMETSLSLYNWDLLMLPCKCHLIKGKKGTAISSMKENNLTRTLCPLKVIGKNKGMIDNY